MLQIAAVRIEGFRGLPKVQSLTFDRPVVILFGEQHQGKSSVLNAIEWCLFGDKCIGKETGMRERIGWEIITRGLSGASVEVQLKGPDGQYTVLRKQGRKGGEKKSLELTRPDSSKCNGELAEKELRQLIRLTFRDFFTTVYQHQEAIRAILTQEPRDRNDAIDRLLGLSDYRNLLEGFKKSKVADVQQGMVEAVATFQKQVESVLKSRDNDIRERKADTQKYGLTDSDLTEAKALAVADGVARGIEEMAETLGLAKPSLLPPTEWQLVKQFSSEATKTLDGLCTEIPEMKNQEDLLNHKEKITAAKASCEQVGEEVRNAEKDVQDFVKEHGFRNQIEEHLTKTSERLEELDGQIQEESPRARLVQEGIRLLEESGVASGKQPCPLCGNEVKNLLEHLREEWEDRLQKEIEALQRERNKKEKESKQIESNLHKLEKIEERLDRAKSERRKAIKSLADTIGLELVETVDPVVVAQKNIESIDSQLRTLEKPLKKRQEQAGAIKTRLAVLASLYEVLNLEDKKRGLEQIKNSKEFQKLESLRDRVAELVEDVEVVGDAIKRAAQTEAKAKIGAAAVFVDNLFRSLAGNPAITKVQILVEEKGTGNDYRIIDQDKNELNPILSRGDFNCLALALFFGLAEAAVEARPFSVVLFDDPSQSLGTQNKRQFVDALDRATDGKSMLISTTDHELKDLLEKGIAKDKRVYTFADWHPDRGPKISQGG